MPSVSSNFVLKKLEVSSHFGGLIINKKRNWKSMAVSSISFRKLGVNGGVLNPISVSLSKSWNRLQSKDFLGQIKAGPTLINPDLIYRFMFPMAETEAVADSAVELPEHVIHHILSLFRFPKEAARKSLLSKVWLRAWRTRPSLQFDYWEDTKNANIKVLEKKRSDFINCIDTTLQRYHENKNGIDKLELGNLPSVSPNNFNRWMEIAIENGVKRLDVSVSTTDSFILFQTIFEAKSLEELSLRSKFQLKPRVIKRISCCNLRKLWLFGVDLDEVMFQRILLSCPLIVLLSISGCVGLANLKVIKLQKLERLRIGIGVEESCCVEVEAPNLAYFDYHRIFRFGDDVTYIPSKHRRLQMHRCANIKHLRLDGIGIADEFFLDIAKKFPRLEDLVVKDCDNLERIKISSHSIKYIRLISNFRLDEVQIGVPSIDQFEFEGYSINVLSFTAPSGPCVSKINLCWSVWPLSDASWFLSLKDSLIKLSESEISLHIDFYTTVEASIVDDIRNRAIFPLPEVQKLSLCFRGGYLDDADSILDAVFGTCRPKTIAQEWNYLLDSQDIHLTKVIFEKLLPGGDQKHINLQETKFWQNDLKDVKLEDDLRVQQPDSLDWDTLLKEFPPAGFNRYFHYELEWESLNLVWKQKLSGTKRRKLEEMTIHT